MAEEINIKASDKAGRYSELLPQLKALLKGEDDLIACMANMAAALKECMGFLWVGFYLVKGEELVLGPFQGPVACTRIQKGRGVCGSAWLQNQPIIVPDVDQFPGHIACSNLSRSEMVLPLCNRRQEVVAVLDVDSANLNAFDETDARFLNEMLDLLPRQ